MFLCEPEEEQRDSFHNLRKTMGHFMPRQIERECVMVNSAGKQPKKIEGNTVILCFGHKNSKQFARRSGLQLPSKIKHSSWSER